MENGPHAYKGLFPVLTRLNPEVMPLNPEVIPLFPEVIGQYPDLIPPNPKVIGSEIRRKPGLIVVPRQAPRLSRLSRLGPAASNRPPDPPLRDPRNRADHHPGPPPERSPSVPSCRTRSKAPQVPGATGQRPFRPRPSPETRLKPAVRSVHPPTHLPHPGAQRSGTPRQNRPSVKPPTPLTGRFCYISRLASRCFAKYRKPNNIAHSAHRQYN